jgi:hypothetical protein
MINWIIASLLSGFVAYVGDCNIYQIFVMTCLFAIHLNLSALQDREDKKE